MAKAPPSDNDLLPHLLAGLKHPSRPAVASKTADGFFPAKGGKDMLAVAVERGWVESVPDPNAPVPKKPPKKEPKKTHARLTPAGRRWAIDKSTPKAALEALPGLLTPPPAADPELAAVQAGLAALTEQVRVLADRRRAEADAVRGLLAEFADKVTKAVAEVKNAEAAPSAGPSEPADDEVVRFVADWWRERGHGCPLDALFADLLARHPGLTVGRFHDHLRRLHAAGRLTLTGWGKTLYEIPKPELALFVSDKVMYYVQPAHG